jgi:polyferredoxin
MVKSRSEKIKRWTGQPKGAWITARKIVQYAALIGFVVLFIGLKQSHLQPAIANLPMRLDPLTLLANSIANHTLLTGSALALVTILLTIVFGRAWCGWLCPLGTILDLFSLKRLRRNFQNRESSVGRDKNLPPVSERWRAVKYTLLIAIIVAAFLGNLTLLIFDPITILLRTMASSIWPALDQLVTMIERGLYGIPALSAGVSTFDSWIRPLLLPIIPVFYQYALALAALFTGIVLLNILAPRFWCRYLCPLGGLLGIFSKAALIRRQPGEDCHGCTVCSSVCPTGTIDPENGYISDPSECTMCLDCLEACPRSAVEISSRLSLAAFKDYDPNRRQALTAMGAAIAAVAIFHSEWLHKRLPPHHLRPPGTQEETLLAACIRCGACVRSCPTGALQPAGTEAGLEGVWTPVIVPPTPADRFAR